MAPVGVTEAQASAARWKRLKELLGDALEQPAGERRAWLLSTTSGDDPSLVDEALAMLDHGRPSDESIAAGPAGVDRPDTLRPPIISVLARRLAWQPEPGDMLAGWTLVRRLGEGGMGSVWLASRKHGDFDQNAAIKLLNGLTSPALLDRLRAEQRALAALHHPNIAHFIDAGETPDGSPFLVMEHVEGVPLDAWCVRDKPDTAVRLGLLLQLADAVAHANERLLVHRDIKPSNVLITPAGQVKLLDFGVAKLMAADVVGGLVTQHQDRLLTPRFASPEQVQGLPASVAVDVYGLAATAYTVLSGELPFTRQAEDGYALLRAVVDTEPDLRLSGDLKLVIAKGLAKSPADRYANVRALAADMAAVRDGFPVAARRPTWHYVARRAIARHRVASLGIGLGLFALLGGLGAALWQADAATDARNRALAEARRAEAGEIKTRAALVEAEAARQAAVAAQSQAEAAHAEADAERLAAEAAAQAARRARTLEEAQRLLAARRFADVRALAQRVVTEYADDLLGQFGSGPTRLKIIQDSVGFLDRLRRDAAGDPALLAELTRGYRKLAFALGGEAGLRDFAQADAHLATARSLHEAVLRHRSATQQDRAESALMDTVQGEMARRRYRFAEADALLARARDTFAGLAGWTSADPWDRVGPVRAALEAAMSRAEPGASQPDSDLALRLLGQAQAALDVLPPPAGTPESRALADAIVLLHRSQVHSVRAVLLRQSAQFDAALAEADLSERLAADLVHRYPNNALYLSQWAIVLGNRKTMRLAAGLLEAGFADGNQRAELASRAVQRAPDEPQALLEEVTAWSQLCSDLQRLDRPLSEAQAPCQKALNSGRALLALRQTDPFAGAAHQAFIVGGLARVKAAALPGADGPPAERRTEVLEAALALQRQGLEGLTALVPAVRQDPLRTAYLVNQRIAMGEGLELAGRYAEATQVHRDSLGLLEAIRALGIQEVYTPGLTLFVRRRLALNHAAEAAAAPAGSGERQRAAMQAGHEAGEFLKLAESLRTRSRLTPIYAVHLPAMQALADGAPP